MSLRCAKSTTMSSSLMAYTGLHIMSVRRLVPAYLRGDPGSSATPRTLVSSIGLSVHSSYYKIPYLCWGSLLCYGDSSRNGYVVSSHYLRAVHMILTHVLCP